MDSLIEDFGHNPNFTIGMIESALRQKQKSPEKRLEEIAQIIEEFKEARERKRV